MIVNWVPESNTPKKSLTNLLKSITGSLFQQNNFCTQIDGVSMGNPLTPTIAHFFIGTLETILFNKENKPNPVLYLLDVDDRYFAFFEKMFRLIVTNKVC